MTKQQLLEAIATLSTEDKSEVLEALTPTKSEAVENAEAVDAVTDEAVTEKAAEVISDIAEDKADAATGDTPDYAETAKDESELVEAVAADTQADEAVVEATAEAASENDTPVADDDIPSMARGDSASDVEAELVAQTVTDEQGGELPIDYQAIIDGLNAKNLALEAENRQLKSKVDGAFGLTAKPAGFAPANPLYNDTTDIPRIKKI